MLKKAVWISVLACSALAARLLSWHAVFRSGRILFIDTDDYYHLRRMMTAAVNFPHLPSFDPYLGFPGGFQVNWPPFYDLFGGLLIRILSGGTAPDLFISQLVAGFIPPIAGTLTIVLFYRAARELIGENEARWASGLAALMPMLVYYTMLGRPDHHCFENLWFPAAIPPLLLLMRGDPGKAHRGRAFAAAALLGLGVSFWIGSILFSAIFCAAAGWELLSRRDRTAGPPWAGIVLLLEAVLLLPCAFGYWGRSGAVLFDAPTAFQPLAAAMMGLALCALHWRRGRGAGGLAAAAVAGAFLCAGVLAWKGIQSLLLFFVAPLPVFKTFSEFQPLLRPNGQWSLGGAYDYFGLGIWFLPPLAVWYAREEKAGFVKRLVLVWFCVTGFLALRQTRYAYHFCLPAALLIGWGLQRAVERLEGRASGFKAPRYAGPVAVAALAAVLLSVPLKGIITLAFCPPDNLTGDIRLIESCEWLRDHTPPAGDTPAYGVYSLHTIGNEIATIAQRPSAASNMHFMRDQILDSVAFFYMQDEEQAFEFLRQRRFRYVLLNDLVATGVLPLYSGFLGSPGYRLTPSAGGPPELSSNSFDFVYMRLYHFAGSTFAKEGRTVPAAGHFRLLYQSPAAPGAHDRYKIFEVVQGARLEGPCSGRVKAAVPIEAVNARPGVSYRAEAECKGGSFSMTVPYAGTYEIQAGGRAQKRRVSETDVVRAR